MSKVNKRQPNNKINKEFEDKKAFRIAFGYALAFVLVLIVFGITGTYAFYNVEIKSDSVTAALSANVDCFDVQVSDTTYNLTYNYPITDAFATDKITPMTITIKNNCTSGEDIPYKLYLTTLPSNNLNIPNSAMKINVKKDGADVVTTKLISTLTPETTNGEVIKNAIQEKGGTASDLVNGSHYSISSGNLAPGAIDTYSFYMWIDYNEGGTGTTNNGTTSGKKFSAIVTAIIN